MRRIITACIAMPVLPALTVVAILAVPVVGLWLAWPAGAGRGWLPGRWLG